MIFGYLVMMPTRKISSSSRHQTVKIYSLFLVCFFNVATLDFILCFYLEDLVIVMWEVN